MLRSVLTIMRGSALAQVVGFLVLPLLSRSFEPTAFGHLQVYQSLATVVFVILMLRYEVAILRAKEGQDLNDVLALCAFLTLFSTFMLTIALLGANVLGRVPLMENLPFGWWWISLAALLIGWAQIFTYLATRDAAYGAIANSKVAGGLSNAATGSALALASPIASGLIIADLAGRLIGGYALARGRISRATGIFSARASGMIAAAKRHRDLSLISLPGALMSTVGSVMTPLFIYATFDAAMAGQFGLVERAVGLPVALIVGAVSQVHMGNLAEDLRKGTNLARNNFRRLSLLVACLALPPTALCIAFSPTLFEIFFGQGWSQAALFAQILAPAYFLAMISGGINMTLTIVGQQILQFGLDAVRLGSMIALWVYAPLANWTIESIVIGHAVLLGSISIIQFILCYRALPTAPINNNVAKCAP